MNQFVKLKKQVLWSLIKSVGQYYGEDDQWLRDYAILVAESWSDRLDEAISCFQDLKDQFKYAPDKQKPMQV